MLQVHYNALERQRQAKLLNPRKLVQRGLILHCQAVKALKLVVFVATDVLEPAVCVDGKVRQVVQRPVPPVLEFGGAQVDRYCKWGL